MISKEECKQATKNWEIARPDYSTIKSLIDPTFAFNFSQAQCDWLNENNHNSQFRLYVGVYESQLILIVTPLDIDGKEIEKKEYPFVVLSKLTSELTLLERDVVTTTKKTTLSSSLEVSSYCEEIDYPTFQKPTISERASAADIIKWKINCLDWFYNECNHYKGKRIFKVFTVPFADLIKDDAEYNEVKGLFGFKHSPVYERLIPILIFVATHNETSNSKIIRLSTEVSLSATNTKDWSQPCPPLCAEIVD